MVSHGHGQCSCENADQVVLLITNGDVPHLGGAADVDRRGPKPITQPAARATRWLALISRPRQTGRHPPGRRRPAQGLGQGGRGAAVEQPMGCMVRSSTGMRASTKSAPISVNSMPRHCTRVWLQAACISSGWVFCHSGAGTGGAMVLLAGGFRRLPAGRRPVFRGGGLSVLRFLVVLVEVVGARSRMMPRNTRRLAQVLT